MRGRTADKERLGHILDAIAEVETYVKGISLPDFIENSMMRFATIKQLEIIGEAANHLTEETKSKFTDVEWRKIVGMRNVYVHEYFKLDNRMIWKTVMEDIGPLKVKVEKEYLEFK